ncbi:DUF805 domain-containing protein [Bifidobacterium sp.]|jgi:uncharacterized membrane protein YhaH (DUF805 family)|uniref:DUF805 domain-containing protein n=1 Tax=Bifidobacterium sp. TaxID=41200 RepID=UPI0025B86A3E|nr:DUF805 domain-containing protein [Bifidobacterium sp.]
MTEPNQYPITPGSVASNPAEGGESAQQPQESSSQQTQGQSSQGPSVQQPPNEWQGAPATDPVPSSEPQTPRYDTPQPSDEQPQQSQPQYATPAETPSYGRQPSQPQYGQPRQPQYGQPGYDSQYSQPGQQGQPQYQAPSPEGGPANPYGQPNTQPSYGQPFYGQPQQPYPQGFGPGAPHNTGSQQSVGVPPLNKPYYGIPFPEAIKRLFQKYVVFSGRASKSEFWWAVLGYAVVSIILGGFNGVGGNRMTWLSNLWNLAVFIPFIAVSVRRLHDANKSGWWAVLPFGLTFLTGAFAALTAVQTIATVGYAFTGSTRGGAGIAVWGILTALCAIGVFASFIVFGVANSNPAGARYDDDAKSQQGGYPGEYPGAYPQGQPPYVGQPYGGQPYGQTTPTGQNPSGQNSGGQAPTDQGTGYGNPAN